MTMNLDDAIASVQRFAALFESVQVIAKEIKEARLVEQLTREAKEARDAMFKEVELAKGELASVKAAVASAKDNLKAVGEKANATLGDAESRAKAVVDDARRLADGMMDRARGDAADIVSKAKSDLSALTGELADLAKRKDAVIAETLDRHRDLAEVEKKIADARALLANFMGSGK